MEKEFAFKVLDTVTTAFYADKLIHKLMGKGSPPSLEAVGIAPENLIAE